jgi:PBP1b-binding outer membrane lipoprotein LpoB
MKRLSLILFVAVALTGCGENTPVQTVDWYKQHDTERKEMIAKCKASPGELSASPNCINAQQADNERANARRGWLTPGAVDLGKKGD